MDCTDARTVVSARLDGEEPEITTAALHAHLATCAPCRAWEAQAAGVHRRVRLAPAPEVPDLVPHVLAAIGDATPAAAHDWSIRVVLAVIAVTQIAVALPALILGEDAGLPAHTARHLGSFAVALGIGFLVAAWRPARVGGVLPVAAAVVVCLIVSSALDVAAGRAQLSSELAHGTELVGLAALWLLARSGRRPVLGAPVPA